MTVRQALVLVALPEAGVPVVLTPPVGFPVWAGCMPSPCFMERLDGQRVEVPGVIVMWEQSPHVPQRTDDMSELCQRPPAGWWCSRKPLHEGPCAVWPDGEGPPVVADPESS